MGSNNSTATTSSPLNDKLHDISSSKLYQASPEIQKTIKRSRQSSISSTRSELSQKQIQTLFAIDPISSSSLEFTTTQERNGGERMKFQDESADDDVIRELSFCISHCASQIVNKQNIGEKTERIDFFRANYIDIKR